MSRPKERQPANRAERRHPETADLIAQREVWPVAEAAFRLGVHRVTLYRLAAAGDIAIVKIGRRSYVTDAELRRYVASLTAASA